MMRFFKPGDLLAVVIAFIMPERPECAGCERRRDLINHWGWRGAWRHRGEIAEWFGGAAWLTGHRRVEPGCRLWLALVGVALVELSRRGRAMPVQSPGNVVAEPLHRREATGG